MQRVRVVMRGQEDVEGVPAETIYGLARVPSKGEWIEVAPGTICVVEDVLMYAFPSDVLDQEPEAIASVSVTLRPETYTGPAEVPLTATE